MFARARDRPTERSHSRKICVLLICTKDWIDSNGILCIHECEYGKKEIQKCVWNIALCVPGLNVHIYTDCIAHSPDASSNALCVFCTHMVCTVRCFVYIGNVHAACYFIFRLFLGFSVWFCSVLFCVAFSFVWKVQAQSCIVNLFESFPADWVFLQFLFILHLLLFFVLSDLLCAKDIIRVAFFVLLIVDCLWTCSFSFFLLFFFPLRRVFFFSVRSCLVVSYIYA